MRTISPDGGLISSAHSARVEGHIEAIRRSIRMRACVLALVPIAFAQPALARNHSHHHATHHFSRHHHHHAAHRHAVHPRVTRNRSWGRDESLSTPQTFARTDAWESGWEQSWSRQQSLNQSNWQQNVTSQATYGQYDPSAALERGVRRAERLSARASHGGLDAMIERHAAANGLPATLVHRVVTRESGYNPGARNRSGALGLMQIKYATARGVGYAGSASGLLDAETNLTYAVKYLAGAYQAAGGNANRAVALYQSGYYRRGSAIAARREQPVYAAQEPSSNWGTQQWDMQTERVAMQGTDVTAVRIHRGHHHRR
jgi:hypothetical protein